MRRETRNDVAVFARGSTHVTPALSALVQHLTGRTTASTPIGVRRQIRNGLSSLEDNKVLRELVSSDGDLLGQAYEGLVSARWRRTRGQFFTPPWASVVMAKWLAQGSPGVVLDPAAGSGRLLLAVATQLSKTHPRMFAVDIDDLVLQLALTNLRLRSIPRTNGIVGDFLQKGSGIKADGIICNPPYGRHHVLKRDRLGTIHTRLEKELGTKFDRRTSLPALFLLAALVDAKDEARIAFITPSGWLDTEFGRTIKRYLAQVVTVDAILTFDHDYELFDGVATTSAITLLRKTPSPSTQRTKVLRLKGDPPPVREILHSLKSASLSGATLERVDESWKLNASRETSKAHLRLSEVADVRRGIATGYNAFFVLSEAERRRYSIPEHHLIACLASPRLFQDPEIRLSHLRKLPESARRWLIDTSNAQMETAKNSLGKYLRMGKRKLKVHHRALPLRRDPWFAREDHDPAAILFPCFNRGRPRFVRNRTKAVALNNWFCIYPKKGVDADVLFSILSSETLLRQIRRKQRVYGGGVRKLEPRELGRIDLGQKAVLKLLP